jgi:hypothetical protein
VLRLLSTVDDYLSWLLVFLPVLSGILLSGETIGGYETLAGPAYPERRAADDLAAFGKLMHMLLVFAGRGAMGIQLRP